MSSTPSDLERAAAAVAADLHALSETLLNQLQAGADPRQLLINTAVILRSRANELEAQARPARAVGERRPVAAGDDRLWRP